MHEKQDEETVAGLLQSCRLQVDRCENASGKAPDFRVSAPGGELFFCEVKSTRATAQWSAYSTIFSNITGDVHDAVKQFSAVNSLHLVPNVLVWVPHVPWFNRSTFIDLVGGGVFVEDTPHADLRKYRQGRFDGDFRHIDLFLWVYHWGAPDMVFNAANLDHARKLARLLADLRSQPR